MLLFEVTNIIKISYEEENQLLIHEWYEYNPEGQDKLILKILDKIYNLHLDYPVAKVLVITDQTKGIFSPEIQKFIKDVQFPRLVNDTKMKYVATVKSEDAMNEVGVLIWQGQFNPDDEMVLFDFASESEARDWLKTIT